MRPGRTIIQTAAVCLSMLLSGCQGKTDPEFVSSTTVGLQVKGQVIFEYDPLTWQTAFNREKCLFRVHTDNMSDYYTLDLNLVPTAAGQKAKGDIEWTSKSSVLSRNGLTFTVEKMDRSGKIWLWCRKEQIGAVVQILD